METTHDLLKEAEELLLLAPDMIGTGHSKAQWYTWMDRRKTFLSSLLRIWLKDATIAYPAVWDAPKFHYGQSVIARYGGGESLVSVIGMRFRAASKWEYQIVDIIDGKPDVYCNGRWYIEAVLSEEEKP